MPVISGQVSSPRHERQFRTATEEERCEVWKRRRNKQSPATARGVGNVGIGKFEAVGRRGEQQMRKWLKPGEVCR